jgi:hypothetical protein
MLSVYGWNLQTGQASALQGSFNSAYGRRPAARGQTASGGVSSKLQVKDSQWQRGQAFWLPIIWDLHRSRGMS